MRYIRDLNPESKKLLERISYQSKFPQVRDRAKCILLSSNQFPIEKLMSIILSQDKYGLYDEDLNRQIVQAAQAVNLPVQRAIIDGFGSDGSIAMKMGHVSRAACLGFPTDNTHGYEIAHLSAIANCTRILASYASKIINN